METSILIDIASAESKIFSGNATVVNVSGELGELGITPGHTPLLTTLKPGQVRVTCVGESEEKVFYISGGLLEVQPYQVIILADTAVRAEDLDEAAALDAEKRAREAFEDRAADFEYSKAAVELAQAVAQIRAVRKIKKSKV